MRKFSIACLAILAAQLVGCGTVQTYEGPKKATHEVALVKTNIGQAALDAVWVGRLDGKELVLAYSELELAPGSHATQILIKRGFLTRSKAISFDAKAGHTYRVSGEFNSGTAWLVDEGTGELVAGEKP